MLLRDKALFRVAPLLLTIVLASCYEVPPTASEELVSVIGFSEIRSDSGFAEIGTTHPICPGPPGDEDESPGSNFGSHVDLTSAFYAWSTVVNDGYEVFRGTSMATPIVAGVAALVRAEYPDLCASQVRDILFDTAVDLGPSGRDDEYGHGLPDAVAALAVADAATPCASEPPAVDVSISGPTEIQPEAICTWQAVVQPPSGNYDYAWYNDGVWSGSGKFYTGGKNPGSISDHFPLRVEVSGAGVGSESITVFEDPSAPVCFQ